MNRYVTNASNSSNYYSNYIARQQPNPYFQYRQSSPQAQAQPQERLYLLPIDAPPNQYRTRAAAEFLDGKNIAPAKVDEARLAASSTAAATSTVAGTSSSNSNTPRNRPSEAATLAAQNFLSGSKLPEAKFYQESLEELNFDQRRRLDREFLQQQDMLRDQQRQILRNQQQILQQQQQQWGAFQQQSQWMAGASPRAFATTTMAQPQQPVYAVPPPQFGTGNPLIASAASPRHVLQAPQHRPQYQPPYQPQPQYYYQ